MAIRVAIIGGGCAGITTAFELSRPEHRGKFEVTVYQQGWRLGGKGASGRGPSDRIEEHGLHIWMGFYENAFRLLRECYAELNRDPETSPMPDWQDAFYPDPYVGVMEPTADGGSLPWAAVFPPGQGLPGDPIEDGNPFSVRFYLQRSAELLRVLFEAIQLKQDRAGSPRDADASQTGLTQTAEQLLRMGQLASLGALAQGATVLAGLVGQVSPTSSNLVLRLAEALAGNTRDQIERLTHEDMELKRLWIVLDLLLAGIRGILSYGLLTDPRGFDAIDDFDSREWLRLNGASETALQSGFLSGIYDLVFGYEQGDRRQPSVGAGQGLRGALRMFFGYRGAFFWKMRAGMGDVVFAPFYEVLARRGVRFEFFHRLEHVKMADPASLADGEKGYVEALEFDVQAHLRNPGHYQPLVDVKGLPCWPSEPAWDQLVDGDALRDEGRDFECFWDTRRVSTRRLQVGQDFDFVVLAVGLGAIPHLCSELVDRDPRWRAMVDHVQTIPTQAFQLWMNEDMKDLGWTGPPITVTAFDSTFDTWADMRQLIDAESWPSRGPRACRAIAYFCSALAGHARIPGRDDSTYPARASAQVREDAIRHLDERIHELWPNALRPGGGFRWELLLDPAGATGEKRFDTQFWTANVNPSDRYVLALPGSWRYRISPLDESYDNLTLAGDGTACGFIEGCVEAAVISGRLAAHALSLSPPLAEIVGFDHP